MFLGTRDLTITVGGESRTAEVTNVRITSAAAESGTTTFAVAKAGGKRRYGLAGTAVQDPSVDTFWDLVWSHVGETIAVEIMPAGGTPGADTPEFAGNVIIKESDGDLLGGEANTDETANFTFDFDFPFTAKPIRSFS